MHSRWQGEIHSVYLPISCLRLSINTCIIIIISYAEMGRTALIPAAGEGLFYDKYGPIAKALLEHGSDVKAADKSGNTTMLMAAESGGIKVVDMLRRNGADIRARESKTPLERAHSRGTYLVMSLLEAGEGVNIHGDGKHQMTALQKAVGACGRGPSGKEC